MVLHGACPAVGSHAPHPQGSLLLLSVGLGIMLLPSVQTVEWTVRAPLWSRRGPGNQRSAHPALLPQDAGSSAGTVTVRPAPRCVQSQPERACLPGRRPQKLDWQLVLYQDWELDACVDAVLLEAEMDSVSDVPFTHQQLDIFRCKLNQRYPQGYPEAFIRRLRYFFLAMTPEDILKWNVTSLETLKSLLEVSRGRKYMSAQVAALIKRYVAGKGLLDLDTVSMLSDFPPNYVCSLSPKLLDHVQESVIWEIKAQHLEGCSHEQLSVLYHKALLVFRHLQEPEHLLRVQPFLGGASTENLRDLIRQNVTIDTAIMKLLQPEAFMPLTVSEVQRLLGPNLHALKDQMSDSPVREWIASKPQSDLDQLGLGLQGGIPNGYLDLYLPEAREIWDSV